MKPPYLSIVVILLAIFLSATACRKDDGTENPASFRSITALDDAIIQEPGGNTTIRFSIDEPDFEFNCDAGSVSCPLTLLSQDGSEPGNYSLTKIEATSEAGIYDATITDNGTDPMYRDKARFGFRITDNSLIASNSFTVMTRNAADGKLIVKTGLPVVYISTGGKEIISKEEYLNAFLSIKGTGMSDDLEDVSCQIRGRGNSTWLWPKKPYNIKLDEKKSLFGFPGHKRWTLLANYCDRTMMRNAISMYVGSMMGNLDWTPRCQSVEVVLNDKHIGNYLLIESVKEDKDRVPCQDGGFLLESDWHYDEKVQWMDHHGQSNFFGSDGIPFCIKYPDGDELSREKADQIKEYVAEVAEAIYGEDFADGGKGYAKYIDVPSFIDYWIVFELMTNHELANPGSVYYHKSGKEGGKLMAGPLWDFDWGVLSYRTSPSAKTGLMNRDACWYRRLFEDQAFRDAVRKRWNELLPQLKTVPDYIDELEKKMQKSAELNFKLWNPADDASLNDGSIINGDENLTYNEAVKLLKNNFQERLEVISKNL